MVGLHNLYWYYGSQTYKQEGTDKLVHTSEAFQGFVYVMFGIEALSCISTPVKLINVITAARGGDTKHQYVYLFVSQYTVQTTN